MQRLRTGIVHRAVPLLPAKDGKLDTMALREVCGACAAGGTEAASRARLRPRMLLDAERRIESPDLGQNAGIGRENAHERLVATEQVFAGVEHPEGSPEDGLTRPEFPAHHEQRQVLPHGGLCPGSACGAIGRLPPAGRRAAREVRRGPEHAMRLGIAEPGLIADRDGDRGWLAAIEAEA